MTWLGYASIVSIAVIAYLPAVDNSFISDDFTLLAFLNDWERSPSYILQLPSELFRAVTNVYFWLCWKAFGQNPVPYYWSGIALHVAAALLTYLLVLRLTGNWLAAWTAGAFFAAYERHQEAVMWISAANETILTLNCLLFLLLWERTVTRTAVKKTSFVLPLVMLALALMSKEAAVALVPAAILRLMLRGYSRAEVLRRSAPLVVMLGVYVLFWLSQAYRNFFVTEGYYAIGWHFFGVYARSLFRLLSPALLILVPLLPLVRSGRNQLENASGFLAHFRSNLLFFIALVALPTVPYSFLTYLNHIPSRNAYFPSVGLAAIVGILFATLYAAVTSVRWRRVCTALIAAILIGNVTYIWVKKEPQYRERAAPTRELLDLLNTPEIHSLEQRPVYVCGFPLDAWIGAEAVAGFTSFQSAEVVFQKRCDGPPSGLHLVWDSAMETYRTRFPVAEVRSLSP